MAASTKAFPRFEYTVRGDGTFPLDMLRYDCSWPATSEDVSWLWSGKEERELMLRSDREPTYARWSSFGWEVTEVRKNGKPVDPMRYLPPQ